MASESALQRRVLAVRKRALTVAAGAALTVAVGATLATAPAAAAPDDDVTPVEIQRYRNRLAEDNPAQLWEARGAELWRSVRGPRLRSLEGCDLGLGSGVLPGAYARLPRYFPDTRRVQDLESRLLTCMADLQGLDPVEAARRPFGNGERSADLEALSAYVAAQSRDYPIRIEMSHPEERAAYALGKAVFHYRAGPYDFSCDSCHGEAGKRIRLQALPDLTTPAGARSAYVGWPAYRVSQGELRTLEWRLADCFRQQRFPALIYGSEVAVALTFYLARNAESGVMQAPALKR